MLRTLGRQSTLCLGCLSRIPRVPTCRAAPQLTGVHSQPVRLAKSWVKRRENQKLRDDTVFQYASKNTKRAQRIYVWGLAAAGALGIRRFLDPDMKGASLRKQQHIPHRLEFMDRQRLKTHGIGCGYGYTVFACSQDKKHVIYGTGINTDSQLGYQSGPTRRSGSLDYVIEPSRIDLPLLYPETTRLEEVACGRAHTVICTDKEGVLTLGHNGYGQCGRPIVEGEVYKGSQVINKLNFRHKVLQAECGQDHTLLLTDEGTLYSFGLGSDGQTGLGNYSLAPEPTLVGGDIAGEKIIHVSSRADCVLAVSDQGEVFGWGNNEYNQFSVVEKDETQVNLPRHLPFTGVGKVRMTAAAGSTCALLNEEGDVFVWGYGILGKGPLAEESAVPTLLPPTLFGRNELHPDSKVEQIACGINNFAAITNHGELYMWGNNKTGCLGLGHTKDQFFPFKVLVPAEVEQIVCGVDHTIALTRGFS